MGNRIEDIFSPERLHRTWKREDTQTTPSSHLQQPARDKRPAMAALYQLNHTVQERFRKEEIPAVHLLLTELRELLEQRFPSAQPLPPEPEKETLNMSIHELLYQIEDLLDALTMVPVKRQT